VKQGKKDDVLQIIILTLFIVSGILLLLNYVFATKRDDAFARVEAAVIEYNWLKENLSLKKLHDALAFQQELKKAEGNRDIHTEINLRLKQSGLNVTPSPLYKPKLGRSKKFQYTRYLLSSGTGTRAVKKGLFDWLRFIARLEDDRPDIHVQSLTLETKEVEPQESEDYRLWTCQAWFIRWEPVRGQ